MEMGDIETDIGMVNIETDGEMATNRDQDSYVESSRDQGSEIESQTDQGCDVGGASEVAGPGGPGTGSKSLDCGRWRFDLPALQQASRYVIRMELY